MALRKFGDGWQIDYYEPPKKAGKRFAKEEIQLMNGLTSGNRSNGQNWSNFSPSASKGSSLRLTLINR